MPIGEMLVRFIGFSDHADRSVSVMIFKSLRKHKLRTDKQDLFSVKLKEIRAFPHHAEAPVILSQNTDKLPGKSICTFKQKQPAELIFVASPHQAAVTAVFRAPDLRVAEVIRAQSFRQIFARQYRIITVFLVVEPITHRNALHLQILRAVTGLFANAGIQDQLPSVLKLHGIARKTSVRVIPFIRRERRGQIAPVQKVIAYRMPPVHVIPRGFIRIVLVEQVILSFVERKTVRIVHPAAAGCQVKSRTGFRWDPL